MFGHQWFSWINNPTPDSSVSLSAVKQKEETFCLGTRRNVICSHLAAGVVLSTLCLLLLVSCAALCVLYTSDPDSKSGWRSLSECRNVSANHLTLTEANGTLKKHNEILKLLRDVVDEDTTLLNRSAAELMSASVALAAKDGGFIEKIRNLTSTNSQLKQELEHTREKLNMSETIEHLLSSSSQQEEEQQRLTHFSSLLRDELFQIKEANQELCQGLSERVTHLQEQNLNLSTMLVKQRDAAAEQHKYSEEEMEQMVADMQLMNEAYYSLDLYCPVVNHKTQERMCKKCNGSWKQFQMKCYYFSSRMLTWSAGRAWCQTQGGDLLIVNNEDEQRFVFDASKAQEPISTRLWIGLTDAGEEGDWRWVDGTKVTSNVRFWLSRAGTETEPDDWKLDNPLGEDCGHIDMSENPLESWMDGSCEMTYRWICEKNI